MLRTNINIGGQRLIGRAAFFVAALFIAIGGCSKPDDEIQIHSWARNGDVDHLVEFLLVEPSNGIHYHESPTVADSWSHSGISSHLSGALSHVDAARALASLVENDIDRHSEIEQKLIRARDNASTDVARSAYDSLLTIFNTQRISRLVASAANNSNIGLVLDDDGFQRPTPAGDLGLDVLDKGLEVDAILVFQELGPAGQPRAHTISPSPLGKSIQEFKEQLGTIRRLGIVYEIRDKVDSYSGDCTGHAYQWVVQIYVIDLQQSVPIGAVALVGGDPPLTAMTVTSKRCDASGSKPEYKEFLHQT